MGLDGELTRQTCRQLRIIEASFIRRFARAIVAQNAPSSEQYLLTFAGGSPTP